MTAIAWEKPVAQAIARKFLLVQGIKQSVPLGAENLERLPGCLVLAPEFTLEERTGSHWLWKATYPAYIIGPVLRSMRATNELIVDVVGAARMKFGLSGLNLGLPYVQDSVLTTGTPELFNIGDDDGNPAYRLAIVCMIREAISPTVA